MEKDFDIYSLIRSEEIQIYFRRNRKLTVLEQEQLILHSYKSIITKWQILFWLRDKAVDGDREMVDNMLKLFDTVISDIFKPQHRTLFVHQYLVPIYTLDEMVISDLFYNLPEHYVGLFGSFEELRRHLLLRRKDAGKKRWEKQSRVHQVFVMDNGEYRKDITFNLILEDGLYYPRDFFVTEGWLHDHDIDDKTFQRLSDYISDYNLPYENGDHIKITLPFKKRPIYGVFERYTENGISHQSFFLNGKEHITENELQLDYQDFELGSGYTVYDWIERY